MRWTPSSDTTDAAEQICRNCAATRTLGKRLRMQTSDWLGSVPLVARIELERAPSGRATGSSRQRKLPERFGMQGLTGLVRCGTATIPAWSVMGLVRCGTATILACGRKH